MFNQRPPQPRETELRQCVQMAISTLESIKDAGDTTDDIVRTEAEYVWARLNHKMAELYPAKDAE